MTDKTRTDKIRILKVEKNSDDGLIVTFSDRTRAGYIVEELLFLRQVREHVNEPLESDLPTTIAIESRPLNGRFRLNMDLTPG
jgi:hypothetical protein